MRGVLSSRAGGLLAVIAWLAAVFAGAVAPTAAAPVDPALAAFVAAGGTPDDICGVAGHGEAGGDRHCDACLTLGPAVLPEAPRSPSRAAAPLPEALPAMAVAPRAALLHAGRPRAPPVSS